MSQSQAGVRRRRLDNNSPLEENQNFSPENGLLNENLNNDNNYNNQFHHPNSTHQADHNNFNEYNVEPNHPDEGNRLLFHNNNVEVNQHNPEIQNQVLNNEPDNNNKANSSGLKINQVQYLNGFLGFLLTIIIVFSIIYLPLTCIIKNLCNPDDVAVTKNSSICLIIAAALIIFSIVFNFSTISLKNGPFMRVNQLYDFLFGVILIILAIVGFAQAFTRSDSKFSEVWNTISPVDKRYYGQTIENFKSAFGLNMILYAIFLLIVGLLHLILAIAYLIFHAKLPKSLNNIDIIYMKRSVKGIVLSNEIIQDQLIKGVSILEQSHQQQQINKINNNF